MNSYFPVIVVVLLILAWALEIDLWRRSTLESRLWAQRILFLAAFASAVFIGSWFFSKHALVITAAVEGQLLLASILTWVAWFFSLRSSLNSINFFLIPLVALFWSYVQIFGDSVEYSVMVSPWLWLHIALALSGEILLIVAALVAMAYLAADWTLRKKVPSIFVARMASLADFERVLVQTLQWGFCLMTGGLVLGIFFANQFWDGQWLADPKVLVAMATWLTYAIILGLRWRGMLTHGKSLSWAALVVFVLLLFLALGMDTILPSRHPFQRSMMEIYDT